MATRSCDGRSWALVVVCVFLSSSLVDAQTMGNLSAKSKSSVKKPTVSIRPVEAKLLPNNKSAGKLGDILTSTPSHIEPAKSIKTPALDFNTIASEARQRELSAAFQKTASNITEQTIPIHNERLRQVCSRLRRELQKRSIAVVESGADTEIEVSLTELGFDSLHGFEFRADAKVNNWNTSAQGRSLNKISVMLAKEITKKLSGNK